MGRLFCSGHLRHIIKIQRRTETQNDYGEPIYTWTDLSSSVRAKVRQISGTETLTSPQMTARETKEFFMRYTSNVDVKDRIVYNGSNYNIEEIIDEEERRQVLTITAVRVNT